MTAPVPATRLDARGSIVLATVDGVTGYGVVRFSPSGEKWEIRRLRAFTSTRVEEAECRLYVNQIAPQYEVEGTYAGSSGDTTDTAIYLEDGQALYVVWSGGDNGATATVTLSGWRSTPAGGFRAIH